MHTVAQVCALFVSSSSPCFMRTMSDSLSSTSPSDSLTFSSPSSASSTSFCSSPQPCALPLLGPQDNKNSTGVSLGRSDLVATCQPVQKIEKAFLMAVQNTCNDNRLQSVDTIFIRLSRKSSPTHQDTHVFFEPVFWSLQASVTQQNTFSQSDKTGVSDTPFNIHTKLNARQCSHVLRCLTLF